MRPSNLVTSRIWERVTEKGLKIAELMADFPSQNKAR